MFDATAKPPAGILGGRVNWTGDYDECINVNFHRNTTHFIGRYCNFMLGEPAKESVRNNLFHLFEALSLFKLCSVYIFVMKCTTRSTIVAKIMYSDLLSLIRNVVMFQ